MYYRRSRSRSPLALQLPHDTLRITDLEHKVAILEAAVVNLTKSLHSWQRWERYLHRVYSWASDIATAFAKFPWNWARTDDAPWDASTAHEVP